ncbi:hypothetical protein [Sorangium sp. So ce854]|uniref:hypothetical protein n=1 Tax=Sorangium sp. So ce854 TaxID=3133322 RepID=UPI003F63CDFD
MSGKAAAILRLVLGLAQMIGAMVSFRLLMTTGVNNMALAAVFVTCLLVAASVVLSVKRR